MRLHMHMLLLVRMLTLSHILGHADLTAQKSLARVPVMDCP